MGHAIIGEEEKKRVNDVLESGMLSGFIAKAGDNFLGGKQVRELEGLVKDYFEVKHAISVNSATAGLHAALAASGVGPGDEVIVTPYTMSASATAIVMTNAVPVFADIDENNFCLDPVSVEERISPRTKAIVVVHLFGGAADMNAIMAIAKKHDLKVIEDAAQAPGGVYRGRCVGTMGDAGVFSLNQHKTITSGEGGFVVTNNDDLALRMQLVRNHGEVIVDDLNLENIEGIIGYNYRMTELEAAVSVGQFKRLDDLNGYRIELAEYLTDKLSRFEGLTLPDKNACDKHVYFVYPIKFDEKQIGVKRDVFVKVLLAEGIPFGAGYVRPIYMEPMYQKKIAYGPNGWPFSSVDTASYDKGICPVCERMHFDELMLTGVCRHPHTKEDMDDVVKAFEKIFKNLEELKN
ncbi:MAG: DegT/DnrJ/EryC1/StrS family aminotransferase [Candidatus Tantalella remota]|nr:DegT/DnrJ/EryC1/StrS family aminotransferase [Candidatus Tantalella remota]